ncbi:MAG: YSIRK-type signal peptide-containing protein [Lactobacillus amylovorus]|jgi:hypothetical protein|nr:YSIRK-type signal peptide-containing protein [Lactobacillus amylovorus]
MRQMRNIQQHFSIRKLTIGAANVLIGLSLLGFGTQTVHADANDTAVQATSEKAMLLLVKQRMMLRQKM